MVRRATLFPFSSLLFPCRCHPPLFPSMTSHGFNRLHHLPDSFSVPSKTKGEGLCVDCYPKVFQEGMHSPASLVELPLCNVHPLPRHKICLRTASPYGGGVGILGLPCEAASHEGRICKPLVYWLHIAGCKRIEM